MAEISRFFNSVNGDRRYLAEEFAGFFAKFLSNGIYSGTETLGTLEVSHFGGMSVRVDVGSALIKGYEYENTTPLNLGIEQGSALDRIDRIVLQWDKDMNAREIRLKVIKGDPDTSPAPPNLVRGGVVYELSLAQIFVAKNATSLDGGNVTDERYNEDVCGFVNSLITLPTGDFEKRFNQWFNEQQIEGFMVNGTNDSVVNLAKAINFRNDERTEELVYAGNGRLTTIREKDGNKIIKTTTLNYAGNGSLLSITEDFNNGDTESKVVTTLVHSNNRLSRTERSVII